MPRHHQFGARGGTSQQTFQQRVRTLLLASYDAQKGPRAFDLRLAVYKDTRKPQHGSRHFFAAYASSNNSC